MRLNVNTTYRHFATTASRKLGNEYLIFLDTQKQMLANEIFVLLQKGTVDRTRMVLSVLTTV